MIGLPTRRAAEVPQDPCAPSRCRRGAGLAAVAVPTAVFALHAVLYGRWIVDDAGITFAYARSLATGAGPVLQPGAEAVEGWSNPAWLALLLVGRALGVFDVGTWAGVPDHVAFPKLLALLLVATTFACFHAVAVALTDRPVPVTVLAGSATAAVPSFVIWTMSGLENALLAASAAALAAVLVRAAVADRLMAPSTAVWCGLLAALAALTRPDGLVYVAAFPLAAILLAGRGTAAARTLRQCGIALLASAVPIGAYLAWRLATFGEYLPNTAIAKAQGLPDLTALVRPGELIGYVGWPAATLVLVVIGIAAARPWPGRRGLAALLVPTALAVAAYAVLQPDWMDQYRFATPVWALGALAGSVAVVRVVPHLTTRARAVVAVPTVVALLVSGAELADAARTFRAAPTAPLCLVATNTARAFDVYSRLVDAPEPSLLAPDVGAAALASPLRVVDLAGLTDRRIARFWADGDMTGLRTHLLTEVRPTFVTTNRDWERTTGLLADPRLAADYVEIATSPSGVTDLVRTDVLRPGELEALRVAARDVAAPADAAARSSPRASCGDVLVPPAR